MWFIVNLACLSCCYLYFTQFESCWALYFLLSLSLSFSLTLILSLYVFPAFMCGFAECFNFLLSARFEPPLGHSRMPQHTHTQTDTHTCPHVDVRCATPTRPPTTQHSNGQRAGQSAKLNKSECDVLEITELRNALRTCNNSKLACHANVACTTCNCSCFALNWTSRC